MGHWTARAAALAMVLFAAGAQAASVDRYSSLWILGDSLSDPGNLYERTQGAVPPSPPYYQGRFSNGPVWAEAVAGRFAAQGLATGNVAFGFARALPNEDGIPDLPEQTVFTAAVSAGHLGTRPLATVWMGANDLLGAIGQPGQKVVARQAARAVADNVLALAGFGIRDALVLNLPDLGRTPAYTLFSPQDPSLAAKATRATRVFNKALAKRVAGLNDEGLNVRGIDIYSRFNEVLDDPEAVGLKDVVTPCVFPAAAGGSVCSPEEANWRAFFDSVHPNAVLHGEIANLVNGEVAPVPLPATAVLLIAALFAMGATGTRRRG